MSTPSDQEHTEARVPAGLLTQKEYARRRGWSKQYVNQLVKQGRIPVLNGRIDPAIADATLAGMRDPSRGPRNRVSEGGAPTAMPREGLASGPVPGMEGTFAKARTVREHFRAMREKMEYEAATGELVRRRDIEDMAYEIGVLFREHMMRAAEIIGLKLAARFDLQENEVINAASDAVAHALRRLHDTIKGNELGFDTGLMEAKNRSGNSTASAEVTESSHSSGT